MSVINRRNHHLSLIFHDPRNHVFRCLRRSEPTIEEITLPVFAAGHVRCAERDARHRGVELHAVEHVAHEPNPRLPMRRRA